MTEGDTIITILYGLIGLTGAGSLIIFAWGFAQYLARIGLPADRRNDAIRIMEWAVGFIITSVVLIALLKFIRPWLEA